MKLYRGTQRPDVQGARKLTSWTPSLSVAVVYAAHPGDWGSRASFTEGSTVHEGTLRPGARVLELCGADTWCTFAEFLEELEYGAPGGATEEDAAKVLNYMHNRYVGRVSGGEFKVRVVDEDGHALKWGDWGALSSPLALAREDFEQEGLDAAGRIEADTYIFADAPATRRVVKRLGYDALLYYDIFAEGARAARELLGCDAGDVDGVEAMFDLEHEPQPSHTTLRVLDPKALVDMLSYPVSDVLDQVSCKRVASNPRRRMPTENAASLKRRLMR